MTSTQPSVKSAQRVLELLEFFAQWRRPASVKEISQSLGYPQSSTSVLLRSLVGSGHFDHEIRTGMYVPNIRLTLATAWIEEHLLSEQSLLRLMERVLSESGHTVMIGAQQGIHVRYLHVLQATRVGRFMAKTGALRSLFHSAAGKMLLTTKPEHEIPLLLRQSNALEGNSQLKLQLESVLDGKRDAFKNGYAMSEGTSVAGAAALAILLPVPLGQDPITLSLGGPIKEIKQNKMRLVKLLNDAVSAFRQAATYRQPI